MKKAIKRKDMVDEETITGVTEEKEMGTDAASFDTEEVDDAISIEEKSQTPPVAAVFRRVSTVNNVNASQPPARRMSAFATSNDLSPRRQSAQAISYADIANGPNGGLRRQSSIGATQFPANSSNDQHLPINSQNSSMASPSGSFIGPNGQLYIAQAAPSEQHVNEFGTNTRYNFDKPINLTIHNNWIGAIFRSKAQELLFQKNKITCLESMLSAMKALYSIEKTELEERIASLMKEKELLMKRLKMTKPTLIPLPEKVTVDELSRAATKQNKSTLAKLDFQEIADFINEYGKEYTVFQQLHYEIDQYKQMILRLEVEKEGFVERNKELANQSSGHCLKRVEVEEELEQTKNELAQLKVRPDRNVSC
jgi:hypothetical protein